MILPSIANIKVFFIRNSGTIVSFFYEKIFHEKIDEGVKNFLQNMFFVGVGTVLSTAFILLFNIIAGRLLGPSGYGNFMLVQSVAMFLYIPMLLGMHTAMIRYCAESQDIHNRQRILSTTYVIVFFLSSISTGFFLIFSSQFSHLFSIDSEIWILSIIFAVFFVFYTLTTSTLVGLHLMRVFCVFQLFFGIILLLLFLLLIGIQFLSFKTMVYTYYIAYGITGCAIVILFLKKYLAITLDPQWLPTLWKYSKFAVIGGLSFTIYTNFDRLLINHFLSVEDVGIYSVYYLASFGMITILLNIFTTVLFPTVSRLQDKSSIFRKLQKIIPPLLIIGIPCTIVCEYIILKLFGNEYPVDVVLILIFAVTTILVSWYGILAWFFASEGINGVRLNVSGTVIVAVLNIILNILLIPLFGLHGAIGATALAFIIGLIHHTYYGKVYFSC